ncbi:MAG: DUF3791 domain-containing protein [Ruminococcaceae bacterium]|nr:DUF3791 domain-containing protein [Oscillospiraceae bacterium]
MKFTLDKMPLHNRCYMTDTLEFKVFCFEAYRNEKKMAGRDVKSLFKKYGVFDYIDNCFDVLNTQGRAYLVADIDMYNDARK